MRVYPIVTHGGDAVNTVPHEVRLETFVRGGSIDAILDVAEKVDRSLRAGALALGSSDYSELKQHLLFTARRPGFVRRARNSIAPTLNDGFQWLKEARV